MAPPRRKTRRPQSPAQQRANAAVKRAFIDWITITLIRDSTRVGRIPVVLVNWLVIAALAIAWWNLGYSRILLIVTVLVVLVTFIRAATVGPRRRRDTAALFSRLARTCGFPRSTTRDPVRASDWVMIKRWRKGNPAKFTTVIGANAPAATLLGRAEYAQAIERLPQPWAGEGAWMVDWTDPSAPTATAVRQDDPGYRRYAAESRILLVIANSFNLTPRLAADHRHNLTIDSWQPVADGDPPAPETVEFAYNTHPGASSPAFRDTVARACDADPGLVPSWSSLYDWSQPGTLIITTVPAGSLADRRKLTERRIADQIANVAGRGKDPVLVTVGTWTHGVHGDPAAAPAAAITQGDGPDFRAAFNNAGQPHPAATRAPDVEQDPQEVIEPEADIPQVIHADLGTRQFGDRNVRERMERAVDAALEASYPGLVYKCAWEHAATTLLTAKAYPEASAAALEKVEERRWRSVVAQKFGGRSSDAHVDITEWRSDHDPSAGVLLRRRPVTARITFGSYDVTRPDTKDAATGHIDQLTDLNDWHYDWHDAEGYVTVTACLALPEFEAFPESGSPDFTEFMELAREGIFRMGRAKGGGHIEWDLNSVPHGLIGGATGAGKSVAMSEILYAACWNPDLLELIVIDPKRTDFTWTEEFPAVRRFADTDERIHAAIASADDELDRRQSLLNKRGKRNLRELRAFYAEHPEAVAEDGPCPRRLILFFDELAEYLAKGANKDAEELRDESRGRLEKIGRLGRAMEVNIIAAAQKPDAKTVSTQLRSQLAFRLCVGKVDQYTSQQILDSDHGTRFSDSVPRGRGWAFTSQSGYRVVQVPYLPDDPTPSPTDPSQVLTGAKDSLRQRMRDLGYRAVSITNVDGGQDPRWVDQRHVEHPDHAETSA